MKGQAFVLIATNYVGSLNECCSFDMASEWISFLNEHHTLKLLKYLSGGNITESQMMTDVCTPLLYLSSSMRSGDCPRSS